MGVDRLDPEELVMMHQRDGDRPCRWRNSITTQLRLPTLAFRADGMSLSTLCICCIDEIELNLTTDPVSNRADGYRGY